MFRFLKNLLHPTPPVLSRNHINPASPSLGDILLFGPMAQTELSLQSFQVAEVSSVRFANEQETWFRLEGATSLPLWLVPSKERGITTLAIHRLITREVVESLFDMDAFAGIFEEGSATLETMPTSRLQSWVSSRYFKAVDCRQGTLQSENQAAQGLDCYVLYNDTHQYGINIHVFDNDKTDVYLTLYTAPSSIQEILPGGS